MTTELGSLPVGALFQLYPKYLDGSRRPRYSSRLRNGPWFDFSGPLTIVLHRHDASIVADRAGTLAAFDPDMRIKVNE